MSNSKDPSKYQKDFSSPSFWNKVKKTALNAGKELIEKALILYYTWEDKDTPMWAKTTIIGALGYFISPIDAVPDIVPMIGYGDDLSVIALALTAVGASIKKQHKDAAKTKTDEIFG